MQPCPECDVYIEVVATMDVLQMPGRSHSAISVIMLAAIVPPKKHGDYRGQSAVFYSLRSSTETSQKDQLGLTKIKGWAYILSATNTLKIAYKCRIRYKLVKITNTNFQIPITATALV